MASTSVGDKIAKGVRNPALAWQHARNKTDPLLTAIETSISSRYPIGQNVLENDWDLLIVLDTCRLDALEEARENGSVAWLSECSPGSIYSIGGSTLEWTAQTFRESHREQAAEIDYVAGNVLVEEVLEGRRTPEGMAGAPWSPTSWDTVSKSALNDVVSVSGFKDLRATGGDESRPHPSAKLVTDLAIRHGRTNDPDRLVVHYIQPHYPYYSAVESGSQDELNDWQRYPFLDLKSGSLSVETLWKRYMDELRTGLVEVGRLLDNVDARRVAITADHGEVFGERWLGIKGYGHRPGRLHAKLRRVPWFTTTATDTGEAVDLSGIESSERSRDEMLEALGYL